MRKNEEGRTVYIDSDPWAFLPPKQRDEYYLEKYGMTFEEYQKSIKPMSDEEFHELIRKSIKK